MAYRRYIASNRWQQNSARLAELEASGFRCRVCNDDGAGSALEVHRPRAGIGLYRIEVFAHRHDRDKACGPTAHPDVHYFPITREELILRCDSLDDIACGCPVDHPDFDMVLNPLFDQTLVRLLEDAAKARKRAVASATLTIARARYKMSAKRESDWLNFSVDAFSAFEQVGADIMDRTVQHLIDRLALQLSPRGVGAKMN